MLTDDDASSSDAKLAGGAHRTREPVWRECWRRGWWPAHTAAPQYLACSCCPPTGLADFGLARLMPAAERQKRNRL